MKKRIGLVGLGEIAQKVYLPLLAANETVEIVGIMSKTSSTVERIQQQYRLPWGTTKLEALLERDLDAVFVHAPTDEHESIVRQCLIANVPVYVDKPLTNTLGSSVELASLAETKGLLLAVGFNRRFAPRYVEAKAWMNQVGGFEWCSAQKHRTRLQDSSAAFTLYDDLIHLLDLLLWLKDGAHYQQEASKIITTERGQLLSASGSLSFAPARAQYSMVRQAGVDLEKLELHGNGRSVEITNLESATFFNRDALPHSRSFGSWDTILYRRGFVGAVEHFLEHLTNPEACTIRADQVLESHRLVESLL